MKKFFVLAVLFLLPILAYLFFASGVNNFAKLPVLTNDVANISQFKAAGDSAVTFQDKISIVAFFGTEPDDLKGNTFNLDSKILNKFYEFADFQFVIILPEEARSEAEKFVEDFSGITNASYWRFVYSTPQEVRKVFESFETDIELDENLQTPYVFIIDKDQNLRGRTDDEDKGMLYGYDSRSVSELNNKMNDDVKVILAEYRRALKTNNSRKMEK
ncbi:hypothetical protein FHG64_12345 [Antarcticibacterium flavum]|uniref:Redoxin domain-containing protein n=1 Tax=Antarcticibacterium flavum TaxID=2058175 RepID=A0A5B7X406_9FLAO|nr:MULTISPECIES: hypothetical protein [Antarcticibacterium]MCM4158366.1 hypothetical protein [Antarcticibacterium sp. W02-3]QCY70127.1 hypothetical protein FHG64_12345 [Antarcticibacterium flavum]